MSEQTTPEVSRTEKATRALRFSAQVRIAKKLLDAGWTVTAPPEHLRGLTNLHPPRKSK